MWKRTKVISLACARMDGKTRVGRGELTLGSVVPFVWTSTALWRNLMACVRRPLLIGLPSSSLPVVAQLRMRALTAASVVHSSGTVRFVHLASPGQVTVSRGTDRSGYSTSCLTHRYLNTSG